MSFEKIVDEYAPVVGWKKVDAFNKLLRRKRKLRYVLLIPRTEHFNPTEDVPKILSVRDKPYILIMERFKSLGVAVEYFNTFSQRERLRLGPISTDVPEKICIQKYKKLYFPTKDTIVFVGSKFLAKKFPEDVRFVSVEQFVSDILFPSK